ncbi:MAG: hydrogenase expression/formation protein HypE [Gemmataceae bacterium]
MPEFDTTQVVRAELTCPLPHATGDRILLAHGEGARLTRRLIREVLLNAFDNDFLRPLADGAVLPAPTGRLVMTTDSYVVSPLFFPGGDIGKLAVHGTINDLAVCGAEPKYLSIALIVEEGLRLDTMKQVVASIRDAAQACRVQVVTGDTKVVPRGTADGLFVNATGIGELRSEIDLGTHRVRPGDRVLVSGMIGDHGIAVLAAREGLELESSLHSDTAPIHDLVRSLLDFDVEVHMLRDPTRGGVSAVLHEVADATKLSVVLDEKSIPVREPVRGICEILGLDPLYVANEGKCVALVAAHDAERALGCFRRHPLGTDAAIIGEVTSATPPLVLVRGLLGIDRILDEPNGAPLPRIC